MSNFDFVITDANVGTALTPENGFVVNLSMTQAPVLDGDPRWDEGRRVWRSHYLVLRGQYDIRDLVSFDPMSTPGALCGGAPRGEVLINASIGYRGGLQIICVPRGSTWSLTLSDVANPRPAPAVSGWAPNGAFGDENGFKHIPPFWTPPGGREPVLVER